MIFFGSLFGIDFGFILGGLLAPFLDLFWSQSALGRVPTSKMLILEEIGLFPAVFFLFDWF